MSLWCNFKYEKEMQATNFKYINLNKSLRMFVNLDTNSNTVRLHGGHRFYSGVTK